MNTNKEEEWRRFIVPKKVEQINNHLSTGQCKVYNKQYKVCNIIHKIYDIIHGYHSNEVDMLSINK